MTSLKFKKCIELKYYVYVNEYKINEKLLVIFKSTLYSGNFTAFIQVK